MKENVSSDKCLFCELVRTQEPTVQRKTFVAKYDGYPVSPGHMLLVPRRHIESPYELSREELEDLFALLLEVQDLLQREFDPDGFNIGVNVGTAAGQTVPHLHIHVIPRYYGDVENPRGGVRGVIPDRADYPMEDT